MPFTAFLHTHTLVVILYVLMFTVKTYLLFTNSAEALDLVRRKTKIVEMILGALIIGSGIYLAIHSAASAEIWFWIKLALVIAGIAMGIVGLKKLSKPITGIAFLCFITVLILSYTKPGSSVAHPQAGNNDMEETGNFDAESPGYNMLEHGAAIYKARDCAACHGAEGDKGLSGAKNLKLSTLSEDQVKEQIKSGKNLMPAYGKMLTEAELNALTAHVLAMRQ